MTRYAVAVPVTIVLLSLPLAACGGSSTSTATTAPPSTAAATTTTAKTMSLTLFRVEQGSLHAETARVPLTEATASASLKALGLPASVTIADGTARVDLPQASPEEVAEIVYTLTQFPSVERVDVAGHTRLTRNDVDSSYVPPILLDSPASGAIVGKRFHVTGSASVFEATLVVQLERDGKVVGKNAPVTASEGAPARGTFDTVLTAPSAGAFTVVAFAPSAEDGSPQHRVEAPVTVLRGA